MAAVDYERDALRAMGLPHPADDNLIGVHEIGETVLHDSPDACRAIVARRLARVRGALAAAHGCAAAVRAELARADFLAYGEYLSALRRIVAIRERLQRIDNVERRQEFDRLNRDTPSFYADYVAPSPLEEHLARHHDPERHTPDWPGYVAYLAAVAPSVRALFYRRLGVLIPEDARRRHTYITGQSGAGKSELLKVFIRAYCRSRAPVSLVVIDPHGDFAAQVARMPEVATSGRLIFVHPRLSPGMTASINPFELTDRSEEAVHVMAEQLASVFNELVRHAGHTGLSGNMGALLVPCLSTLLTRPGSSIRDLQIFMDDKLNRDLWEAGCRSRIPAHRDFFREQFHGRQFDSTKMALHTRIQSLLNSPVLGRLLMGRSTVDLEAAVNAGKIVVFALPKGKTGGDTAHLFGVFVLAMLQGIAMRREDIPERERVPIHAFIDECQNFLSPSVKTILDETRKFGLHLTLAQQHVGQDMAPDLMAAVISNTAVKMCGQNDVKTLKAMDERMGVGVEALQRLSVGQFFVKVSGSAPAFKLLVPRVGGQIDEAAWAAVKAAQLRTCYRPHDETPPEAPAEPPEANRAAGGTPPPVAPETPLRTKQVKPERAPARAGPPAPRKVDFV